MKRKELRALPRTPGRPRSERAQKDILESAYKLLKTKEISSVSAQEIAHGAGVSTATLYRWWGSRELLHERILEQRAREFGEWARAEATGDGVERVLAALRLILDATAAAQPVRRFMEREPHLALRVLTRRDGAVHQELTDTLCEIAEEACADLDLERLRDRIGVAVHVGSALQWGSVAIDEEPPTDYILEILRRQIAP